MKTFLNAFKVGFEATSAPTKELVGYKHTPMMIRLEQEPKEIYDMIVERVSSLGIQGVKFVSRKNSFYQVIKWGQFVWTIRAHTFDQCTYFSTRTIRKIELPVRLFRMIPIIGHSIAKVLDLGVSPHRLDTANTLNAGVHWAVQQAIEEATAEQGIRLETPVEDAETAKMM